MVFFIAFWVILVIGLAIHVLVDRHAVRRTGPRVVELAVLWLFVFGGIYGLLSVYSHTGPLSVQTAEEIGYAPSMFQWEVGFGDLTLCVLGIGVLWFRDRWLTAAAVAIFVSFGGDAIGHIMEWSGGNTAPGNVWALPSDLLQGILGLVLLVVYRRGLGRLPALPKHGVVGTTTT
jgi:hypothetical protein